MLVKLLQWLKTAVIELKKNSKDPRALSLQPCSVVVVGHIQPVMQHIIAWLWLPTVVAVPQAKLICRNQAPAATSIKLHHNRTSHHSLLSSLAVTGTKSAASAATHTNPAASHLKNGKCTR
jgi:hypothetical protein